MYLQVKSFTVKQEFVDQVAQMWTNRERKIDGIIDIKVFVDDKSYRDEREVMIQIYWESQEKCKAWRTHPDHVAAHKNKKEKPEGIIKVEQKTYHLY